MNLMQFNDVYLREIKSLYTWKILIPECLYSSLYSNTLVDILVDTLVDILVNILVNTSSRTFDLSFIKFQNIKIFRNFPKCFYVSII